MHDVATRMVAALAALTLVGLPASVAHAAPDPDPAGANNFGCSPSAAHPRPVVLVHGLGATKGANWSYMSPRIHDAGYCVFALTYGVDPRTETWPYSPGGSIPMEQSAPQLAAFVDRVLAATGASQVDLVGHSEGTVMPRYYLERLGGVPKVRRWVALTPLWRGTNVALAATLSELAGSSAGAQAFTGPIDGLCGSCRQLLHGSDYLDDLNADGEAIPGIEHTNIITRYDELVVPYKSGIMRDGGTNIVVQDVCPANASEHALLAFDPTVARLILNALDPEHAAPVPC